MKVAIDARALTYEPSGVGVYTRTLVQGLAQRDDEDQYLLISNRPVISLDLPPHVSVNDHPFPVGNLWLQARCPAILRREKVDLFHGTNFLSPLLAPCPTVLTVHDLSSFLFPKMHTWRNNAVQRLLPAAIRRAKRVIAISENTKRDLIKRLHVPGEKIRVVHNALPENIARVDDEAKLQAIRRKLSLPETYFLFVGTLEPRKNLVRLLEAFAAYRNRNGNRTQMVLVGAEGWGGSDVHDAHRRLGLGDTVRFAGYIAQDDLPAVYSLARALVMPSVYEGFGLPAIEAMACGTPVVAAANSGLVEVVGEAALTVDHRNVDQLAQKLMDVDHDADLRERCVQAGLRRAKEFGVERFAADTHAVYREAIGKRA